MGYIYILKSLKTGRYYIGSTVDLEARVKAHNAGYGSQTTSWQKPWQLVCFKKFANVDEARREEKIVKSYKGGQGFKKIINGELAEWSKAPHC